MEKEQLITLAKQAFINAKFRWSLADIVAWAGAIPADVTDEFVANSLQDFVANTIAEAEADGMIRCTECGWLTDPDNLEDGFCFDCWHNHYFECDDCHERHDIAEVVIYERGGDQWNICRECANGKHYVVCQCGNYATKRKGDYTRHQEFVCDRCKNSF